jgi:putative FmdB family regulatory protein
MPTYEYACKACGERTEVVQSFSDDPLTECPACGGPLRKVFGTPGIVLKGSGFYKTDNRASAGNGSGGSAETSSGDGSTSSSDGGGSTKEGGSGSTGADHKAQGIRGDQGGDGSGGSAPGPRGSGSKGSGSKGSGSQGSGSQGSGSQGSKDSGSKAATGS